MFSHKKRGGVIGVALFLCLFFFPLVSAASGCFTEPTYPSVCTAIDRATADAFCAAASNSQDCINRYFFENTPCGSVSVCTIQPGTWCADSCRQVTYPAQCTNRNLWINQTQRPDQCRTGCAVCDQNSAITTDNVCQFGLTQTEATSFCGNLLGYHLGLFDISLTSQSCTNLCPTFASPAAAVTGFIKDSAGNPQGGASVRAFGVSNISLASGSYFLGTLPVGNVVISIQKDAFQTAYRTALLTSGQTFFLNVTISPAEQGRVIGTISDTSAHPLSSVSVSVSGVTSARTLSDASGHFQLDALPYGDYVLTAQLPGFQDASLFLNLSLLIPVSAVNITLSPLSTGTIQGQVTDENGRPIPFAHIFFNNIFMTYSASNGFYSAQVFADSDGETYAVSASKTGYQLSAPSSITVHTGAIVSAPIVLVPLAGVCSFPVTQPVLTFTARSVPGEKAVQLLWQKPCAEVRGYIINRSLSQFGALGGQATELFLDAVPGVIDPLSYTDTDISWNTSYTYRISAVYTDVNVRVSEKKAALITTGNPRCGGTYHSGEFYEFCDGNFNRKICNEQNQIVAAVGVDPSDCSVLGPTFFCSGPDTAGDTHCRDTGICSVQSQNAQPFGLWFNRQQCYGNPLNGFSRNYCTFDRTITIFDACYSCVNLQSCFQYQSKDACITNNCLVGSCAWVDSLASVGAGYCAPLAYNQTNHCGDCSSSSPLFRNALCSPSICTALGACYSTIDQSSCASCSSSSSCSDFLSQEECTGGIPSHFVSGDSVSSNDACNIGRCSWNDATHSCFKDGNGDGNDDCASFAGFQSVICRRDTIPPVTVITPSIIQVNTLAGRVTFQSYDTSGPKRLYYCIDRTSSCFPNATAFVDYNERDTITSDLLSLGLRPVYTGSGSYFLRYYSEDVYNNRENIQSKSFTADLQSPEFISLHYNITLNTSGSNIIFAVDLSESAVCHDRLVSYAGATPFSELPVQRADSWTITYTHISDGLYRYEVNCTDDFGNKGSRALDIIDVDAIHSVTIISPSPVLQATRFPFIVNTSDDSTCDLLQGNAFVEHMNTTTFSRHHSSDHTFSTNIFFSDWKVRCTTLATGKVHEKIIPFTIDQLAPHTTLVLTSEDGLIREESSTGWSAVMATQTTLRFNCIDNPINGYGCKETRYCLVPSLTDCTPTTTGPLPSVINDTHICFFSVDSGANAELKKCGTISLTSDFGITLLRPLYGLSSSPHFDLAVNTLVASDTCKWAVGNFNFTSLVSPSNVFSRSSSTLFEKVGFSDLLADFPVSRSSVIITIQCNATTGRVSPPQLFEVGLDQSPPTITSVFADPALVVGGNSVDLVAQTDDRTICRYGPGASYAELLGTFPGFSTSDFVLSHRVTLGLSAADDGTLPTYNVSCMNRALNVSSLVPVTFAVNFSAPGAIVDQAPRGIISNTTFTLSLRTNKNAFCEYLDDTFKPFTVSGGMFHTQLKSSLSEGIHSFPVRCTFTDSGIVRSGTISFTIDASPPVMLGISDGNFSCSLTRISAGFQARDDFSPITSYDYQLLERQTSLVLSNRTILSNTLQLSVNLTSGKEYFFKVKPFDALGHIGAEFSSDGFIALVANATQCREKNPPRVSVLTNLTPTQVSISLLCVDETGCTSLAYNTAANALDCAATIPYTNPVPATQHLFFCYSATDGAGNTATGVQAIDFPDEDGDHVTTPFDICPRTPSGESVDARGCSVSQISVDTDKDHLPDQWELQYNGPSCPLDPHEIDTNSNGVEDGDEDYDHDGVLNVDEYRTRTGPCESRDSDGDGMSDAWEIKYGFNVNNPDDARFDPDHDGLTNLEEFRLGTNPAIPDTDGDGISDGGERTSHTNPLDRTDAPRDKDHNGIDDLWELKYCSGNCDPSGDIDRDGATNLQEYMWNTNPIVSDTDGDGLPDGWEIKYTTIPRENDAASDYDKDGLTNLEEYSHHTNPNLSDSDSDGLPDSWEVRYGLDPTTSDGKDGADGDTDKDGLTNSREFILKTNPSLFDSDGDGWDDGKEISAGTSPIDPLSYPGSGKGRSWLVYTSILLLVILCIIVGYLIFSRFSKKRPPQVLSHTSSSEVSREHPHDIPLQNLYDAVRKRRELRERAERERRRTLFSAFGSQTTSPPAEKKAPIPELAAVVHDEEKTDFEKLQALTERYIGNRKDILLRLAPDEKHVFEKLAHLARHAQKKKHYDLKHEPQPEIKSVLDELVSIIKAHEQKKSPDTRKRAP